jgi:tetratricopeptide (TPR) repeat protein
MSMNSEKYTIQKLNLLAFPRNFTPICELTGEHATVELVTPHITLYYVSAAAAQQAWDGIIKKIAHLLTPLRSDPPIIGTAEERETRTKHILDCKRSLIDFCLIESTSLISNNQFELAVPAATQALKLCKELFGEFSIEVVEPMLQLSQSCLGLNQLKQAEEYLALAQWNVLSVDNCSDKVLARLHLLSGRVLTAQGNFNNAKEELAQGIYYSSRAFGAESVATSSGYYRLGDIFLAQGNKESALAFFDKVVDIWYKNLLAVFNADDDSAAADKDASKEVLTDEHFADGKFQLGQILSIREGVIGEFHIATGEVSYCLGLFEYLYAHDLPRSLGYIRRAQEVYAKSLGAEHASSLQVQSVLNMILAKSVNALDSPTQTKHLS